MTTLPGRAVHAVAVMLTLAIGAAALKRWQRYRAVRGRGLLALPRNRVSIVYFHSRSCGVCRVSQKPILERLVGSGAAAPHLVSVDVEEREDLARAWGVTTVPSIYVVDACGEVAHVNNGFTSEQTLRRQLARSVARAT